MIEVTVRKDEIKISGHANYAVSGSDIVCAGVTALAQTLIKSIEDLTCLLYTSPSPRDRG